MRQASALRVELDASSGMLFSSVNGAMGSSVAASSSAAVKLVPSKFTNRWVAATAQTRGRVVSSAGSRCGRWSSDALKCVSG